MLNPMYIFRVMTKFMFTQSGITKIVFKAIHYQDNIGPEHLSSK